MSETRIPTQKRSIEKRNKIVEKGFELICNNGYYNVTTKDIASYCNISTGIVYQYFNDKKEIFIEGVKKYSEDIMYPMLFVIDNEEVKDLKDYVTKLIDKYIERHTMSKKAHEELMAMSHLDEDIANIFKDTELLMTERIVKLLRENNVIVDNEIEKVHIIINLVDNLCHEVVYHKHSELNYDVMKEEVVNTIISILK